MIYTVTLNPALDYVMRVPALQTDGINRAESAAFRFGGKGINVSVMLARLGVESTALGLAAGFTGRELCRLVAAEGIKSDLTILPRGETRVNVKLRSDAELDVNAPGPEASHEDMEKIARKLSAARDGDIVVLSGAVPHGLPADTYDVFFDALDKTGAKVVVDASGDTLRFSLARRPFLVKPNHHELGELFGTAAETPENISDLALRLREAGAENVLVSRAEKGAMLFCADGAAYSVGVVPGALVDSACCGDAAVAGFLAGHLQTGDPAEALRLGAACGNATAFCDGLADADDVRAIFARLAVEKL